MFRVVSSQGLVIVAAATVVSSTALFLAFSWPKNIPPLLQFYRNQDSQNPPPKSMLRSCLYSGDSKRKRKKKKVKFAENVKEPSGNGEMSFRRRYEKPRKVEKSCTRNKIIPGILKEMPENRIALYHGILKDREHRMECSL